MKNIPQELAVNFHSKENGGAWPSIKINRKAKTKAVMHRIADKALWPCNDCSSETEAATEGV